MHVRGLKRRRNSLATAGNERGALNTTVTKNISLPRKGGGYLIRGSLEPRTQALVQGFGGGTRRDAEDHGQDKAATAVHGQRFAALPELLMAEHQVLIKLFGEIVHFKSLAIAFDRAIPAAKLLPAGADTDDMPQIPAAQTLAQGDGPRGPEFFSEKRTVIERLHAIRKVCERSAIRIRRIVEQCLSLGQQPFESPGIHPAEAVVKTEPAVVQNNRLIVSEKPAQPMQCGVECLTRGVALGVRP